MTSEIHPAHQRDIGEVQPFPPDWHIQEVKVKEGTRYEVRDFNDNVVASGIKLLSHARLFALAPQILENFIELEHEAVRALGYMIDTNAGYYDVDEVAGDASGRWERISPGVTDFARWLLEVRRLREAVCEQTLTCPL